MFFGSAIFSVTAYSALPYSYQWVFNGEPIANETNADLILGPLTCAQTGYYSVIASNAAGAVSSSKARLTIYQTIVSNANAFNSYSSNAQEFLLQFTNIMVATAGSFNVCALKSDGTVAGYAPNTNNTALSVPPGLSDVVAISGGENGVLALRGDGTVAAWGYSATNVPGGLFNVTACAGGGYDNIALQSDGTVIELGYPNPPRVPPSSNVVAVAAGEGQFLELKADGTVAEWAQNEGQPEPRPVPGLSNVIAITAVVGSLALKADGTVVGWDGLATNPLPGVSNVVAIAIGPYTSSSILALKSDGTVASAAPYLSFPIAPSNVFAIAVSSFLGGIAMMSNGAPAWTVQPGNQIQTNGGTVWLHARAVGAQPMSYQWQLNGANILNATNADLTLTNTAGNDSGQYCALASNHVGTAASRPASVTKPPIPVPYTLAQALDATNLTCSTFGNALWFPEVTATHDGVAAAQSGRITNSMSSELEATVTGPGTLTFWWKVSSEEDFDLLSFYIGSGTAYAARISGEVDWQQETFSLGAGSYNLLWIYTKDPDVSAGQDAGWVDQVSFVPAPMPAHLGVPTLLPDGSLLFNVFTTNGEALALSDPAGVIFEASSNLVDWIALTNALTLTNGGAQLRDPTATDSPARFYRLLRR